MSLACASRRIAFKNVLVATDLSRLSEAALLWARGVARRYGSQLYLTHVISPMETALMPPEYCGFGQQAIEEAAVREMQGLDANLAGLPHKALLQHGSIWESISAAIEKFEIDLLVMGTHGREGLGRLMMGSVAEEVIRRAPCPVVTVGAKVTAQVIGGPEFGQILFATHFGPESLASAPYAISLAQEFHTRLTLLHVMNEDDFDSPADPQVVLQTRTERLRKIIPPDAELVRQPDYLVEFGEAADQILRVAEERNVGLIVLGAKPTTGHMTAATHFSAAVTHKVVCAAMCPVLTVRG